MASFAVVPNSIDAPDSPHSPTTPHWEEEVPCDGLVVRNMSGHSVVELSKKEARGLTIASLKLRIFDATGFAPHRQILRSCEAVLDTEDRLDLDKLRGLGRPGLPTEVQLVLVPDVEVELDAGPPRITRIRVPRDGTIEVSFIEGEVVSGMREGMSVSHCLEAWPAYESRQVATECGFSPLSLSKLSSLIEYNVCVSITVRDCRDSPMLQLRSLSAICIPGRRRTLQFHHLIVGIRWIVELCTVMLIMIISDQLFTSASSLLGMCMVASILMPGLGATLCVTLKKCAAHEHGAQLIEEDVDELLCLGLFFFLFYIPCLTTRGPLALKRIRRLPGDDDRLQGVMECQHGFDLLLVDLQFHLDPWSIMILMASGSVPRILFCLVALHDSDEEMMCVTCLVLSLFEIVLILMPVCWSSWRSH